MNFKLVVEAFFQYTMFLKKSDEINRASSIAMVITRFTLRNSIPRKKLFCTATFSLFPLLYALVTTVSLSKLQYTKIITENSNNNNNNIM